MKYGELTFGQMEAIVNKLGGMEGVKQLLSGELVVFMAAKVWKTWRTLKLGVGPKTADEFLEAIKKAKFEVSDWAKDILGKEAFAESVSSEDVEVELVIASVADLGFKEGARYEDICKRAVELGLDLCPAEVGPQLRLQYLDQPKGEVLFIAMRAITVSCGDLSIFDVERSDVGELGLDGDRGFPGYFWRGDDRFVWLRRK